MVKKFLEEKGIKYEEVDVSNDVRSLKEMVDKSGQEGVPVVDVEGTTIVGFDKDAIKGALDL